MSTTEVLGRKAEAEKLAELLRTAGHRPQSVTVLGVFAHVTFRGRDAAWAIAPIMQRGGFQFLKITEKPVHNVGSVGWGAKWHREYTAHFKVSD